MLTILAPAYYSDWSKVKYLKESAEHYSIPVHWYGFGKPYTGWYNIQIIDLLEELKSINTEYVLYTDASDAMFNTNIYEPQIAPNEAWIIMSQEHDNGLCAGGWFGPREYAIEVLEFLRDFIPIGTSDIMNPQERWREASKQNLITVFPDYTRAFFQVMDEPIEIRDGALYNARTGTFPSIAHWAGGYTALDVGKAALIDPYWEQLGF